MLAYVGTKEQFLDDGPDIQDKVKAAVEAKLGIKVPVGSPEYNSWQNSLGNAMFHVLDRSAIPNNAGVAIEYRIHGRGRRIDFMCSGFDGAGGAQVVVVEMKQWTEVAHSPFGDCVQTAVGRGIRTTPHPSYQAWSYASLLHDFYEAVSDVPIALAPCAYAHNCPDPSVIRDIRYGDLLVRAPVFLKGERDSLGTFLSHDIQTGDDGSVLDQLDASRIRPSRQLVEALRSMLDGNDEFVLIDEQKVAFEQILQRVEQARALGKATLVVEGGPGTGKSVIAINALVRLLGDGFNARYVTKNAAPRDVYRRQLQGQRSKRDIANLFVSSDLFRDLDSNELDVALVDEAHRLVRQGGFYGNLGTNQISEIINAARVSVFFIDEAQHVTWRDIGTKAEIQSCADQAGVSSQHVRLSAQFRCAGADEYLAWLDVVLGFRGDDGPVPDLGRTDYDLRIFDDPAELRDAIFRRNQDGGRSRLLAGYCWEWVSKKDASRTDINFPGTDFAMKWNLQEDGPGWMIEPTSINEVGCIHTCQGLEGDYMGVIIGPDLRLVGGVLVGDTDARARSDQSLKGFKKARKEGVEGVQERAEALIRQTYRTLLTRGMRGTYIHCTEPDVADWLKARLPATALLI